MTRKAISNFCAIPGALFLIVIGILHGVLNVSGFRRAIARGDIAGRYGESVLFHAAFAGATLCMLGLLVLLVLPGLRLGSRYSARVTVAIGVFLSLIGIAGYLRVPTKPSVLIFLLFGALLAAPILIWRREFANP